jgi:hypothetical protein
VVLINLLSRSVDFVKKAGTCLKPVHKILVLGVLHFNERRDINSIDAYSDNNAALKGYVASST